MLLQQLKEQVFKLPPSDRFALVSAIIESLQDTPISQPERSSAIRRMRGLLKTPRSLRQSTSSVSVFPLAPLPLLTSIYPFIM
ncbi:MAG: hypothetical protein V7L20_31455 [Nostoc sp.]|uniref:hypothetical protein n=1 Tax=Nostoc sp. TaxID=1180 RepID=UPI002FF7E6D9